MAAQPLDITKRHPAPRDLDTALDEVWLENPFDFLTQKGVNLSMFERNRMFFNRGPGKAFADVSFLSGTDTDADTRAVAVGDLDEDGRPDLVVRSAGGGPLKVFLNRIAATRSITVQLRGRRSNSAGLGARLVLEVGERRLYREHFPHNSLLAQNALETIFGVDRHPGPFRLTVTWPSGTVQVVDSVDVGRITVTEPE